MGNEGLRIGGTRGETKDDTPLEGTKGGLRRGGTRDEILIIGETMIGGIARGETRTEVIEMEIGIGIEIIEGVEMIEMGGILEIAGMVGIENAMEDRMEGVVHRHLLIWRNGPRDDILVCRIF